MPSRATARWLLLAALVAIGCGLAGGAWAQAIDVSSALAKIGDQGIVGTLCLLLIAVAVWAMREKGKAEDALRENDKERVAEAKEIGKLTGEISRTMATLAAAMEAGNRTAAEGNVFRQTIAQSMESLEKSVNATSAGAATDIRELRAAFNELNGLILRSISRGAP